MYAASFSVETSTMTSAETDGALWTKSVARHPKWQFSALFIARETQLLLKSMAVILKVLVKVLRQLLNTFGSADSDTKKDTVL